ncbi:hypothetical protein OIB37_02605 [Streptomyces sp. NBC_00820]|uniref:hypothetical protein n=1 Tax=Streptomyces sp. NBC_00820 TaxID=2975842 RepID=UPI002ED44AA3|nr:hypothetical protein OIB37_02605 [Streptomyces sp. NBC_00820]
MNVIDDVDGTDRTDRTDRKDRTGGPDGAGDAGDTERETRAGGTVPVGRTVRKDGTAWAARGTPTARGHRTARGARTLRSAPVDRTREPIYAQLVSEWRIRGRTVPGDPDVPRTARARFAPRARPEGERARE